MICKGKNLTDVKLIDILQEESNEQQKAFDILSLNQFDSTSDTNEIFDEIYNDIYNELTYQDGPFVQSMDEKIEVAIIYEDGFYDSEGFEVRYDSPFLNYFDSNSEEEALAKKASFFWFIRKC